MINHLFLSINIKLISLAIILIVFTQETIGQNERPTQIYHYDKSHQILKLKEEIKNIEKLEVKNENLIDSKRALMDSLEELEKDNIYRIISEINSATHFEFDNYFASRSISQGRPSGLVGPTFYPSLTFKHRMGMYAHATVYKYTDPDIRVGIPQFDLGAGYGKSLGDKWYVDAGYSRSFVLYGTKKSRELMVNGLSAYASYDLKSISIDAAFSYYWSAVAKQNKQTQSNQLTLSIDRFFQFYHFCGSYKFIVDPTLKFVLGSDNSYQVIRQLVTQEKKKTGKDAVVQSVYWGLLAIDFSVPLKYRMKNIDFYITPKFVMPFNVLDETTLKRANTGSPVFYFTGGINYRFRLWK